MDGLIEKLPADEQTIVKEELAKVKSESSQAALYYMAFFPLFMLVCYVILIVYFRTKGGYQAEVLTGDAANDTESTGGVDGAMEG